MSNNIPLVSHVQEDGTIIETVYDGQQTSFAVFKNNQWAIEKKLGRYIPYKPTNNLIRHNVILFPSIPEEYQSEAELLDDIRWYIHRYVDISVEFERITAAYVLLTWLYDRFNELPYLRVKGDYGTGKTRFLLIVGSICYKPIFASGASTISPIFHLLNTFRGTLIIDEADFRFSDEKAEIVKILNNGNVKGMPVLNSPKYTCYQCRNKIPVVDLEAIFHEQLRDFLLSDEELESYLSQGQGQVKEKEDQIEILTRESQKLKREMDQVYDLYIDQTISSDGFGQRHKPLEARHKQIENQLPQIQAELDVLKINLLSSDQLIDDTRNLYMGWPELPKEDKRKIIEAITESIVIEDDEIAINLCYLPTNQATSNRPTHRP